MAYAQPSDIEARLGRDLDEPEAMIVEIRLEDVEILIYSRIPDLDQQITAGTIVEQAVVYVEAEAILRLIRNPDGLQTESDGNYAYTIDQRVASGRLAILEDEWSLLGVRRGVMLLKPVMSIPWAGPWYVHSGWFEHDDQEHPSVWWQ